MIFFVKNNSSSSNNNKIRLLDNFQKTKIIYQIFKNISNFLQTNWKIFFVDNIFIIKKNVFFIISKNEKFCILSKFLFQNLYFIF